MFSRKVISSILFTILVVQIFMPIVLFFPVKKFFKKCASIAIEKGEVERMTLSKSDYFRYKVKDENELKIDDVYFDIERRIEEGDNYVLIVYRDLDETILFDAIAKLFGKKGSNREGNSPSAFNLFDDFTLVTVSMYSSFCEDEAPQYLAFNEAACMRSIFVFTPPPEYRFRLFS